MSLLTVREAGERLRVSQATVYHLCADGQLPHLRIGTGRGAIRITEEELAAFLERSKVDRPKLALTGLKHLKV